MNNRLTRKLSVIVSSLIGTLFLVIITIPIASANTATIPSAKVLRILISSDETWGGCMAALSVDPAMMLADCLGGWVSFSCSGDFTDSTRAYRMLDQAQLAFATGKNVMVTFEDNRMHNGYCFAQRIDILNN